MAQLKPEQFNMLADALTQPAFAVKDGAVCYANAAFAALQIAVGTKVTDFLSVQGGELPVSGSFRCSAAGLDCDATAVPLEDSTAYLLSVREQSISVHAICHTVMRIRNSLHRMYSSADTLCEYVEQAEDERLQTVSAEVLREIYRLERTAQNLELLQNLRCGDYACKRRKTDILAYLSGLLSHTDELLRYADIRLTAELPEKRFNGWLDPLLFEAVFWNAVSNAAKNTQDGRVLVRVSHRGRLLQLTFVNRGTLSQQSQDRLFARYQVPIEQALGEAGFGLSVIRQAVGLHGGTMLFATKPGEEVAFTVSLDLSEPHDLAMHTPEQPIRSLDSGLIGLADILPPSAYDSRDIL